MRLFPFAVLALAASSLASTHASECRERGEISGRVETVNFNQQLQYGVTRIDIEVGDKTYFAGRGVVIGQIVGAQPNGLPILNHTVYFVDGTRFHTYGDQVIELTPVKFENGQPCAFDAVEAFTSARGTRQLRRLSNGSHTAFAKGRISYCSDDPRNSLELYGEVCVN